ncbi:hybrid sensor histidine kinase/response regulator [Bryobacter aggregatus]|uniref:hybrid sensor histidine kinase/response regulator n=1 Tax=Bryobacter aggregatus TaxID=360054 RepID=UPI00138DDF53|nr:response regulator [Bryobacter aggregatus]
MACAFSSWGALHWWQLSEIRSRVYRIGADHAPPFYHLKADGTVEGIAVEVMDEAARQMKIRLQWVPTNQPDEALESRQVDLWPALAFVEPREGKFHFTTPWIVNNFVIVSLKQAEKPTVRDFEGRTLGIRGGVFTREVMAKLFSTTTIRDYPFRDEILTGVCRGEVDGGLFETRFLDSALTDRPPGCDGKKFSVLVLPDIKSELSIVSLPENAKVADLLRTGVERVAAEGGIGRALGHWSAFTSIDANALYALEDVRRRRDLYGIGFLLILLAAGILSWQFYRLRQAEQVARTAQSFAENASQAKSDFLANVSHEIRTPLNGVIGMTRLLMEGELNEEKRQDLIAAHYSAESLLAVLNDVLDFSKIEAGQLHIVSESFNLYDLLQRTVHMFRSEAEAKGLQLRLHYPHELRHFFSADSARVRQIVMNYIGNATKFTEKGEIRVQVVPTSTGPDETWVRIEVHDTGIGIATEAQPLLFEKFVQADPSTTRKYGGTGLGLAISHKLAQLLGGQVGVNSQLGVGSCFWFEAPYRWAAEAAPLPPRHNRYRRFLGSVLVAEDNVINQRLIAKALEHRGLDVRIAIDGVEAIEATQQRDFDLIFMDCQMPRMDGYEATKVIRTQELPARHIPIVAITANAFREDELRCLAVGMDEYLSKPIDLVRLDHILATYLKPCPLESPDKPAPRDSEGFPA